MEFDIHIQPYPYYGHMELPFGIIKANMDYERNNIFIEKDKLYISNSTAYSTYLNKYDLIDKFAIEHLHFAKAITDIDITKVFQMHYMFFSDPSENQTIMKDDLFIDVCPEKKKDLYYPILKCSRQCEKRWFKRIVAIDNLRPIIHHKDYDLFQRTSSYTNQNPQFIKHNIAKIPHEFVCHYVRAYNKGEIIHRIDLFMENKDGKYLPQTNINSEIVVNQRKLCY